MEVENTKKAANQMAVCPITRKDAVQSLLKEIVQAEKVVKKSLKSTEAYIAAQGKMCKCSNEALDMYRCIYGRLKMLQSLFNYMEGTARQL